MKTDGPTSTGTGVFKRLQKYGNSYALIIDKGMLDVMGVSPESEFNVTVQGGGLTITPSNVGAGPERIAASIKKLRPMYGEMLKNLAK
ncbi:MAG TPA: AbrB/MazE/SpoVT family DNA-binding domain-containing protein [Phycisphaerales bacterium]|nr:AbrB/MazE/SpoVT family DNA-binding domain-containing protein [Phycisphaerales bacterium]